jgi:hypothetical protein
MPRASNEEYHRLLGYALGVLEVIHTSKEPHPLAAQWMERVRYLLNMPPEAIGGADEFKL